MRMTSQDQKFRKYNIAIVIPSYRVEGGIQAVLMDMPCYAKHIIVVDDASPDATLEAVKVIAKKDRRISLLRHDKNQGVGGAMRTGFHKALELGAQIVVKVDGDGQMDLDHLPEMLIPLIEGRADYSKGNRFHDFQALQQMPLIRRVGNMGLSFLTKAATGYWNIFDPTNGFIAIRANVLAQLPLDRIDRTFFFETSMLANLYMIGAVIRDVPMPARYGGETSNLSVRRTLFEFPLKLLQTFLRRLVVKYMILDFSMASIYLITGLPLLLFGLIFGSVKWMEYSMRDIPAPTGTVMLPTLSVLLGIQFLIAAIEIDLRSTPDEPLSPPL
jgi:glycosyltransferase involved in cell wall biosynthesis